MWGRLSPRHLRAGHTQIAGSSPIAFRHHFAFCLCADDYALAPGVSRGICEALEAGALTATSVMTTSPFWPDHAAALKRLACHADIGLHLNLTLGAPLGPMPKLAPGGQLPQIGALMRTARRRDFPVDEVAAEVGRQLDRFVAVFGGRPDHVDGHQHAQVIPAIRETVLAALRERGWTPWLRDSGDGLSRIVRRRVCLAKSLGLAGIARGFGVAAKRSAFATNDGFSGFSRFDAAVEYRGVFDRYLVAPGTKHLVMCHPGYIDDDLRRLDPVVATREQELAFLLSRDFRETLARHGARLARMSQLILPPAD